MSTYAERLARNKARLTAPLPPIGRPPGPRPMPLEVRFRRVVLKNRALRKRLQTLRGKVAMLEVALNVANRKLAKRG